MSRRADYYRDYYARNRKRLRAYQNNWRAGKSLSRKRYLRMLGLTWTDYHELLKVQDNRCAICAALLDESSKRFQPHVDHCHKTGAIRGILCGTCNTGIGLLGDDYKSVKRAALYLKQYVAYTK